MSAAAKSDRGVPFRKGLKTGKIDRRRYRVPQFNVSNAAENNSPFWQEFIEGYVEGYFQ